MENNIVWIAQISRKDYVWTSEKFRVFSTERNAIDWAIKTVDSLKDKEGRYDYTFEWDVYALTLDQPDA